MFKNIIITGLLSLILSACGGGGGGSSSPGGLNEKPTGFTLSQTAAVMVPFRSVEIKMIAGQPPYTITSTNPQVAEASVSSTTSDGFFILSKFAPSQSTAAITVTDGRAQSLTVQVSIAATTLAISPNSISARVGNVLPISVYGGVPPYTFSSDWPAQFALPIAAVGPGPVSIQIASELFTSSAQLIVRDATGQSVNSTVALAPRTAIVSSVQMFPNNSATTSSTLGYGGVGDPSMATVVIQVSDIYASSPRSFQIARQSGSFTVTPASVTTDSTGKAIAYVQLNSAVVTTEQALLNITDALTGETFAYRFTITGKPLSITPPNYTFVGMGTACSSSNVGVTISGGVPPYKIESRNSDIVVANPPTLNTSGQSFAVQATGKCAETAAAVIVVTDAAGTTVNFQAYNFKDISATALKVTPEFALVNCASCSGIQLNFTIVGGKKPYTLSGAIPAIAATLQTSQAAPGPFQVVLGGSYGTTSIVVTDGLGQTASVPITVVAQKP